MYKHFTLFTFRLLNRFKYFNNIRYVNKDYDKIETIDFIPKINNNKCQKTNVPYKDQYESRDF